MLGWHSKRFAPYGLVLGLAGLSAGLLTGCHKASKPDNRTQPPVVEQAIPAILATQGVPFASVTPQVQAWVYTDGVGKWVTSGFRFSVLPALPGGLSLDPSTGQITGTPATLGDPAFYDVSANNSGPDGGGTVTFAVSLGVQAASTATLDYAGTGAVSTAVGGALALDPPRVAGGTPSGFGISPALPPGVVLNPGSGAISGSPTAVGANASGDYLLTATTINPAGSANAPLVLAISATQPAAPIGLAYPGAPYAVTAGQAFTSPAPTVTAGTQLVFAVPTLSRLPSGFTLDARLGTLSVAATTAPGTYDLSVYAANGGGSSPVVVSFTVE